MILPTHDKMKTDNASFLDLQNSAYRSLRNAVISGVFRPGEKISIRRIAKTLGLSLTPVREALKRLATEGALLYEPYKSMRIPVLSEAELTELWMMRGLLEGAAAQQSSMNMDTSTLEELYSIEIKFEKAHLKSNREEVARLNANFHMVLYKASGFPRFLDAIDRLWLNAAPMLSLYYSEGVRSSATGSKSLHNEILKAIKNRQHTQVRELVEQDIHSSLETLKAFASNFKLNDK
jgi:DNA-binding GntR family transcriptional regulator